MLAKYGLDAHGMHVEITISEVRSEFAPQYNVMFPGLGNATKLLLMSFRSELITMVPVDPSRLQDEKYMRAIDARYKESSKILIDKYIPGTNESTKALLTSYIINMMLGLGDLEVLIADDNLEEIAVNGGRDYIWVFHKQIGWCRTNIKPPSDESIYEQAAQIGRRIGREINNLTPLMDAELADGSRVNATLYPISNMGNTITIRKFEKNPWTMTAMIKNRTVSSEIAALVWLCIQNEISLLYSGGTASGKTSFLNATSMFFQSTRRIVSIEETRELMLPSFLQWIPMMSRQPNPEGKGEVTLYKLMINALRQRPDVMLVGEIRTEKDAETLFEAIHTGHAVYSTVHADNAQDVIIRMTNPPIGIPKITMNALGGIAVLFRHRAKGIRRLLEFGEVLDSGDVNVLHRWDVINDSFNRISEMTRLMETLTLFGGYTRKELAESIEEKRTVLEWMVRNDIMNMDDAGYVVAHYYRDKSKVLALAAENAKFSRELL